jgi:hypothetical protein
VSSRSALAPTRRAGRLRRRRRTGRRQPRHRSRCRQQRRRIRLSASLLLRRAARCECSALSDRCFSCFCRLRRADSQSSPQKQIASLKKRIAGLKNQVKDLKGQVRFLNGVVATLRPQVALIPQLAEIAAATGEYRELAGAQADGCVPSGAGLELVAVEYAVPARFPADVPRRRLRTGCRRAGRGDLGSPRLALAAESCGRLLVLQS